MLVGKGQNLDAVSMVSMNVFYQNEFYLKTKQKLSSIFKISGSSKGQL